MKISKSKIDVNHAKWLWPQNIVTAVLAIILKQAVLSLNPKQTVPNFVWGFMTYEDVYREYCGYKASPGLFAQCQLWKYVKSPT